MGTKKGMSPYTSHYGGKSRKETFGDGGKGISPYHIPDAASKKTTPSPAGQNFPQKATKTSLKSSPDSSLLGLKAQILYINRLFEEGHRELGIMKIKQLSEML